MRTCQKYSDSECEYKAVSVTLKDLENIYNTKNNLT